MEIDYKVYLDAATSLLPVKCDDDCMIVDAGQNGCITVDDFRALLNALPEKYRVDEEMALLVNSRTDLLMRSLNEGTGKNRRFCWQPPNRVSSYDLHCSTFMGAPIIINEHLQDVPVHGQSAIIAAIVNLKALLEDADFDGMVLLRVPA